MKTEIRFTLLANVLQKDGSEIDLATYLLYLKTKPVTQDKRKAPAIIVSGVWKERKKLIHLNKLVHVDIDHVENVEELKREISQDSAVFLVHKSFSGSGLKVFARCEEVNESNYTQCVILFMKYIESKYNVKCDEKCKDIKRLCFLSYDDEYYLNENAEFHAAIESEAIEQSEFDNELKNKTIANIIDLSIVNQNTALLNSLAQTIQPAFVKGSRNTHINKLCWKFKRCGVSKEETEKFILSRYNFGKDFTQREALQILKSVYNNVAIEFGVERIYHDSEYLSDLVLNSKRKKEGRNNLVKELIKGYYLVYFLRDFTNEQRSISNICKIIENKIYILGYDGFMADLAEKYKLLNDEVKERITWSDICREITEKYLSGLEKINYPLTNKAIYFRNGKKIDNGIISDVNIDGDLILAKNIFNFDFVPDESKSKFETFIENVFGIENKEYVQLIIGYIISREEVGIGEDRAVLLMDTNAIEDSINYSNGGTGKSLFATLLGEAIGITIIDGKSFDDARFSFSSYELGNGIILIDDVSKKFDFEKLYNLITSGIEVERKFENKFRIPKEMGVKILITSNFKIQIKGDSNLRRRFDLFATNYYNATHTVSQDLGKMGLKYWDDAEKCRFFTYIAKCWREYKEKGYEYLVELSRNVNSESINQLRRMHIVSDAVDEYLGIFLEKIKTETLTTDDFYFYYNQYCESEGVKDRERLSKKRAIELMRKDIEQRYNIRLISIIKRNGNVGRCYKLVEGDLSLMERKVNEGLDNYNNLQINYESNNENELPF
jgi:hypothetical protein